MIHFKKIISGALACVFAAYLWAVVPSSTKADSFNLDDVYEPYFIVSDADDPTTALYGLERDADLRVEPASTTKILSCIVAIEETEKSGRSLDDMATISAKAVDFNKGNSLMGLEEGDTFSLRDLLYGMMLPSGNDAAIAIAEHVAGDTSKFAELMNAKAAELGMTHSHFVTVHGKHNSDHYTTVRDMALLTAYALKNEMFCDIVATPKYKTTSGNRELTVLNSNRMLIDAEPTEKLTNPISCLYEYAIGVKTGDTTQAGKCLVAAARKEGITLIAVLYGGTLNDETYDPYASDNRRDKFNARRFQDAAQLFDYVFDTMEQTVTLQELKDAGMQTEFTIDIPNAIDTDPNNGVLVARADLSDTFTMKLMAPKLRTILESAPSLAEVSITNNYAPISEGSVVGKVSYVFNGETLLAVDLLATRNVKEGLAQVAEAPTQSIGTTEAPQSHSGGLIADVKPANTVSEESGKALSCGNAKLSTQQLVLLILLPILLVLLFLCFILFILYVRNENKKRKKREALRRKKAAAKKRAMQDRNDRY